MKPNHLLLIAAVAALLGACVHPPSPPAVPEHAALPEPGETPPRLPH
jgi:hypothetical protein